MQIAMRNISVIPIFLVLVFALHQQICSAGILRLKRDLSVWPAKLDTSVYKDQPFLFWCNESRPISACEINFQTWDRTFTLNEATEDDAFEYPSGAKFSRGECGIRVFKAVSKMSGTVVCNVRPAGQDDDSKYSILLRVQTPPSNIQLSANNAEYFEFEEGEQMTFVCSVMGGHAEKLELLIDEEVVVSSNRSQLVSYTKPAHFSDHKRKVVCSVHHETFTQPQLVEYSLRVSFKPRAADGLDEDGNLRVRLNFSRGQNGSISIKINAYPMPRQFDWSVAGQEPDKIKFIPWPRLTTDGKFWLHGLNITDLSDDDFNTEIFFTTSNKLGSISIPVVLTEEKDYLIVYLSIAASLLVLVLVVSVVFYIYRRKKLHDKLNVPSSRDHKFRLSKSAVAIIKGWQGGTHISNLDPDEIESAVKLMKNSIPGFISRHYSKFEEPELKKIERSSKLLVLILNEEDRYKELCSSKLKIITVGHFDHAIELVTFPPLKIALLDDKSKLVISKHKVTFRGNNILASDLFGDCIMDLRIADILQFKLDENSADPEQPEYIPQALATTDAQTKYPSTTALVNEIKISLALRHLIVGDAGTGKTQTLLSLEKQFGQSLPYYWILRKDLSHCNKLHEDELENIDSIDALRLLFEDVLLQLDSTQRRVLEMKVRSGKVVFLMDSFDAVWRRNVTMVLRLINAVCEKGILVVSTRSHRAAEAASNLKMTKTYQLAGLDQSELVSQQWKREKVSKSHSEVKALLKRLHPNLKSVPLHLLLSAKYFANRDATADVNLVELFREHVEMALNNQEVLVRGLLQKLSSYHLFEGELYEKLSETELEMLRGCPLVKITGKEAEFEYRSVGQFLFATAAMRRTFKQPKLHEEKFKQILLSSEQELLRSFMDQSDEEGIAWLKCFQPTEKNALVAECLQEKLFNLLRVICQGEVVMPNVVQMLVASGLGVDPENFSQFLDYLEANGEVSNEDKNSALGTAFGAENVELVTVLLDRGADPGTKANSLGSQDSYLHFACALGNLALVKIMAEVLDVEGVDAKLGRTPLMLAVDNDRTETAAYLLEAKGARLDVVDVHQDNCLHLAARSSDDRLLELIVSRAATSVDAVNARAETALLCAAKCGRTANVNLLLIHGADPHLKDVDGCMALDWAIVNKHKDIVDILQGK